MTNQKMSSANDKISLTKEEKEEAIGLIKEFFLQERDEELGDLPASLLLDFITEKLSSKFYNKGVYDSYLYISDRSADLLGLQK